MLRFQIPKFSINVKGCVTTLNDIIMILTLELGTLFQRSRNKARVSAWREP